MIGAVFVFFLQLTSPAAVPPASETPQAAAVEEVAPPANVIPAGMMDCNYDRPSRTRHCTTSEGDVLRCKRERRLGSRFYDWVCFTHREDQQIQNDTHQSINRQQRITTPG